MLVVPQGFTWSVTGVFAITAGQSGIPRSTAIWLFVTGVEAAFCGVGLVSGAFRETSNRPVSVTGLVLANLLPAAVVPAACCASWWIGNKPVSFLTAGAAADTRLQRTEER